jgi:hypothetical protein
LVLLLLLTAVVVVVIIKVLSIDAVLRFVRALDDDCETEGGKEREEERMEWKKSKQAESPEIVIIESMYRLIDFWTRREKERERSD